MFQISERLLLTAMGVMREWDIVKFRHEIDCVLVYEPKAKSYWTSLDNEGTVVFPKTQWMRHNWWRLSSWHHRMETLSALLDLYARNSPVIGEFLSQKPVTRSFDVDLCLNKWLSKQSWGWWFETPSRPLWRHCNFVWVWVWAAIYWAIGRLTNR